MGIKRAAAEVQTSKVDAWFKDAAVGMKHGVQICGKTGERHLNRGLNKLTRMGRFCKLYTFQYDFN